MTSRSVNMSFESVPADDSPQYKCCPCHGHESELDRSHKCTAAIAAATAACSNAASAAASSSRHITFATGSSSSPLSSPNTVNVNHHNVAADNFSRSNSYTNINNGINSSVSASNVLPQSSAGTSATAPSSFQLEARVELLEERLDAVLQQNATLREKLAKAEARQAASEGSNNELYKRLGVLITTTGTLSERMKSLETTTFNTLQAEIEQQRAEGEERDADIAKLLANFKEELSKVAAATNTATADVVAQQQRQMAELSAMNRSAFTSVDDQRQFIEAEVRRLVSVTLDDFQRAQSSSLQEMARKLEQEIEKRHRRLVESTQIAVAEAAKGYETAAPQIRTLQNEMLQIRENIRMQSIQIDSQRNDTSFETAINEMKEWVQDIERKLITRTEVEEVIMQLSSQLSSVKHSSQTTEAMLAQRLEVEKSARESAVSQLASQLLMSGKRGK